MRGRRVVRRRGAPNRNVQIAQILTLLVLLIIVLTFRTKVSDSAGRFLQLFAVEGDLAVEEQAVEEQAVEEQAVEEQERSHGESDSTETVTDPESTSLDIDQ